MGCCTYVTAINAETAREGYERLVEAAIEEYGNSCFNGTISTTEFGRIYGKTGEKFTKTREKKMLKEANEALTRMHKGECRAYDCGIIEYQVVKLVKNERRAGVKATPKYVTAYEVVDALTDARVCKGYFRTKTEAKKAMEQEFLAHPEKFSEVNARFGVNIVRRPVLVEGNPIDSSWHITYKVYKSKPKSIPAGAKLREIRRYVFAVAAAE